MSDRVIIISLIIQLLIRHSFADLLDCSQARFPQIFGGSGGQIGTEMILGVDINHGTNTVIGVGQFTDKNLARD